jgi:hypothetical protein
VVLRASCALWVLLGFLLSPAGLCAAGPAEWVPARWEGGPLELARRAGDKALAAPGVRDAIAQWYEPTTLDLFDGTPVNCLLLTFSGGADRELEKRQWQLVREYAAKAHQRGVAVLGVVYPGADPSAAARAAADARLDGLVLEGEFPGGPAFVEQLGKELRSNGSSAVVIPVESSAASLRKAAWPVLALRGVSPEAGKPADDAVASATAGVWIDSNMWLMRSFRPYADSRPVWLAHRPPAGLLPEAYLRNIADAAAAGGRWIVTLDDDFRVGLLGRDAKALALWKRTAAFLAFFAGHAEWRNMAPFGTVGIVFDTAGPHLSNSEEFLNLVARRQIPYRVIDRSRVDAGALADLRAVLAFDLAPPAETERKMLRDFAERGGLVLGGPSWGTPPKDQPYTVAAIGQGELAVYKDETPDPQSVARDLNDLLTTLDLGVNLSHASVLSYVSRSDTGDRTLIQLVNYADVPAESLSVWITGKFNAARLYAPETEPVDLPMRRSSGQTEILIPKLPIWGTVALE